MSYRPNYWAISPLARATGAIEFDSLIGCRYFDRQPPDRTVDRKFLAPSRKMTEACEILLVEDNLHDAEMTARALDAYDLAKLIYHVKDGEEALDYLFGRGLYAYRNARRVPRFVLLDINLPRVSGLEVLRQIKANDRTKRIPVVIFTASREEQDRIESHHLGVNSYITKPLDAEQFAKTISEAGLYWMRFNPSPASEQGTSSKWM